MKKKFAAVGIVALSLLLTNCSGSEAQAVEKLNTVTANKVSEIKINKDPLAFVRTNTVISPTMMAEQAAIKTKLIQNTIRMDLTIQKLKKHLHSQYGYGDKPGYWDCSGLVRWFYKQQGITLYHSATAESLAGKRVKNPKPGDIVAFHYGSAKWSFHVGIYIGDGKVLHAYNPYADTVISKISTVNKENGAWASYTRIIQTN